MKVWQLQEAKAKLSELVKLTKKEPQVVSVRGKDEVILLSFLSKCILKTLKGFNFK